MWKSLVYVMYKLCLPQDMHFHTKRTETYECDEPMWISMVRCPSVVVYDVVHLVQYVSTEPYGWADDFESDWAIY